MLDEEEIWRGVRNFPGYQVSSYGNVIEPGGGHVETYFSDYGEPSVLLEWHEYSFRGPIWRIMLRAFYDVVDPRAMVPVYRDENPMNLDIYNLRWEDSEGVPMLFRRDSNGDWKRYRKQGRRVRIVETGEVFANARECAQEKSYNLNRLYMCLRGEQKTHYGLHFEVID